VASFKLEFTLTLTCLDDPYNSWQADASEIVERDIETVVRMRPRIVGWIFMGLMWKALTNTARMRRKYLKMIQECNAQDKITQAKAQQEAEEGL
jgi:hypothetical protein